MGGVTSPLPDHLLKAARFLRGARTNLLADQAELSTLAAYQGALHVAVALLLTVGVEAETHRGLGALMGLHFVKEGLLPRSFARDLGRLASDRDTANYEPIAPIDALSARSSATIAVGLVRPMLALLRARAPEAAEALAEVETATEALAAA